MQLAGATFPSASTTRYDATPEPASAKPLQYPVTSELSDEKRRSVQLPARQAKQGMRGDSPVKGSST